MGFAHSFGLGMRGIHNGANMNQYSDAPRGAIMTEDGKFYLTTEDEQSYIAQEIYTIPEEI
jgi:hypothetical protein